MRDRWPEEVPVLTADDIHKGDMISKDGKRRCLLGWKYHVFPDGMPKKAHQAMDIECGGFDWAKFNDSKKTTKAEVAAAWNRAMARCGYTEGNPEAK